MILFDFQRRQLVGNILVLLQFSLLTWLVFMAAPFVRQGQISAICWMLLALSGILGGWTLLHNRLGNFNVHPQPKASGVLVTSGPYRLMRHPMYSTVLLSAAATACVSAHWMAWFVWLALLATLLTKAILEERWLCEHHPQYAEYCLRCKRFIPGVF